MISILSVVACKVPTNLIQNDTDSQVNNLATLALKHDALLGEGAFWDVNTQQLYWIDIEGKKVFVFNPATSNNREYVMPSRVGTVVPQSITTAIVALEDGVYTLNLANGSLTVLSDVERTVTSNRFNDGKCDPNGNLWVGSMHLAQSAPSAKVYKIAPDGTTQTMIENVTISNGIVWTKDAKTMYYIDTPTGFIRAYDYDKRTSTISNERIAVKVPVSLGYPDGMAIDENDHLWVGMWNGNCVAQFDPVKGTLVSKIIVPAHNVTSCAFGGKDLDTMYITTASLDMTAAEIKAYPLAGSVFVVKPGVKGVRSATFGQLPGL